LIDPGLANQIIFDLLNTPHYCLTFSTFKPTWQGQMSASVICSCCIYNVKAQPLLRLAKLSSTCSKVWIWRGDFL